MQKGRDGMDKEVENLIALISNVADGEMLTIVPTIGDRGQKVRMQMIIENLKERSGGKA